MKLAHGVAVALIVCAGAVLVMHGRLTIGGLTLVTSYIVQLLKPIERINDIADTASRGMAGGERLLALLALCPTVTDRPDAVAIGRAPGRHRVPRRLVLVPVARWPPARVLRGVSLRIDPGQMLVLVGPSGAGKSTLINLLLRLFDPTGGTILPRRPPAGVDDAAVAAHADCLDGAGHAPVRGNGARGVDAGRGDRRRRAPVGTRSRSFALDDFVRALPLAARRAARRGRRERVRRAAPAPVACRAFVLDRPILLLDEPLAHVDAASEAVIVRAPCSVFAAAAPASP
jgi:ABC-type nitrate/sulfonate/bicarbonate transport system ATPase subunit